MQSSTLQILLPNSLPRTFDYIVPEGMALQAGDYVAVSFSGRELNGVVWGNGGDSAPHAKLKSIKAHYAHLPSMQANFRRFIDWAAWYTLSPIGAVMKMCLPVADALKPLTSRERGLRLREDLPMRDVKLSPLQAGAAKDLEDALGAFSVTLLDGVTGSGKTEVYFDAIARLLDRATDSQILVLLPEIALSVQWLERFKKRFGFEPYVWHSGLTPARRKHTWRAIVQGEARAVVGARSALFLPFRNLQLIVVDEEHDASFKQEDGVMYHARDMAVARGKFEDFPVVLVSATPSVETLWNVSRGKYREISLRNRHAGASFPNVELIDMRGGEAERGAFIGAKLRAALAENLADNRQSMLFLNRRGYAPLMLCRKCGFRFQCANCTAWLVLHKTKPRLQCHHCGFTTPVPETCPDCQAEESFHPCGPGVERIAEEVNAFLPEANISLLTSDAVDNFDVLQARIAEMEEGKTDILIGTQIVAKGHHFSKLTLVGIVDADLGLNGGDLRASERTYQLLHQLSGRAGREVAYPGRVLIQSFVPDHPVMQALVSGERDHFMELELNLRESSHMPPFTRLVSLIIEGIREDEVIAFSRDIVLSAPNVAGMEILGPAPAPLYRLRDHYRYRILIKAERELHIQKILQEWLLSKKQPSSLRLKIDIDPYSFM